LPLPVIASFVKLGAGSCGFELALILPLLIFISEKQSFALC